jgi:hypothetical protein
VSPSTEPSPSEPADVSAGEDSVGFFYSGVDPTSRQTYKLVYAINQDMLLTQEMFNAMSSLSEKLNFDISFTSANGDADMYINNLQVVAEQGVDGFVADINPTVSDRINEVYLEIGIPYIALLNPVLDADAATRSRASHSTVSRPARQPYSGFTTTI